MTYSLDNLTSKLVEVQNRSINEHVEVLENADQQLQSNLSGLQSQITTLDENVVKTVNSISPTNNNVKFDVVNSWNGNKGSVSYTAPVTSVNGKTGAVTATSFAAPNYAGGYAGYSAGTSYTLSKDGFLHCQLYRGNTGGGSLALTINGHTITMQTNDYSYDSCLFPVFSGDVVSYTVSGLSGYFVRLYGLRTKVV